MDLPPIRMGNEQVNPPWDADGMYWSTSSNDEEESVMDYDDIPTVFNVGPKARTTQVGVEMADMPQLSPSDNITDKQKGQDAPNMEPKVRRKKESFGPFLAQSSDSDDSLASIPAKYQPKETPVPLPPTVTTAGSLPISVSSQQPRRPICTPTPVPLPPTIRQSTSSLSVSGKIPSSSAPVIKLSDSKIPAATSGASSKKPGQTPQPLTLDRNQRTPSFEAYNTAASRTSNVTGIEIATDGRPYSIYLEPGGQEIPTRGALIPAGYKLHTDPRLPFICPVRECRRPMKSLISLSGHFGSVHRNARYNDNGDGTLTRVGSYTNLVGSSPGIVVTQNSTSSTVPLPAEPRSGEDNARASKRQLEESHEYQDSKRRAMPENRGDTPTQFGKNTFSYMLKVYSFQRTPTRYDLSTPRRPGISMMLELPRKRDLPKGFLRKYRKTELSPLGFACATAYVIGDEVSGSLACHAATGPLALLSKQCIVLPSSVQSDPNIIKLFSPHRTCIGCRYLALVTGKPDRCELKTEASEANNEDPRPRVRTSSVRPLASVPVLRLSQQAPQQEQQSSPVPSGREVEQTLAARRSVRQSVNRQQVDKPHGDQPPTQGKSPSEQPSTQPDCGTPIHQQGQFGTPDYEMEDWEIAPGRVISQDSSRNVAYSGAFLTSSAPITLSPDICFNVLTIRPGQIYNVPVEKDRIKVFSVASGKLRVSTGGEAVQLGPNGAFPVRPGEKCVIENRIYFEAVVHCTTVKDYELA